MNEILFVEHSDEDEVKEQVQHLSHLSLAFSTMLARGDEGCPDPVFNFEQLQPRLTRNAVPFRFGLPGPAFLQKELRALNIDPA